MGEASKSSGELGEKYVSDFLELIGWTTQSNKSIICNEPEKHNTNNSQKGRRTHGIDELYTYESPLNTNTLIHTVISVKHNDKEYPASPNSIFKKHIIDLAHTIECYSESELIVTSREDYEVDREEIVGILFWLSNGASKDFSVISKINNPELANDLMYERIHIMDNDRVEFITKCIHLVQHNFSSYSYTFYYIDTPNNLTDTRKQCNGKSLPIEMLSSNIQVFKVEKNEEIILVIIIKDKFHSDTLKRILGLAHRISNNLTSNVQIYFPEFEHQKQENKDAINRIKNKFKEKNFIQTTHIYGYDLGFKSGDIQKPSTLSVPSEIIEEKDIDVGDFLPYGEYLRTLLSTSLITSAELKKLLREKGIFVCNSDKKHTIPILSSLLLSPQEFDTLKEHQKTKEDKEKRHESRFKTISKPTLIGLKRILKTINLNNLDTEKFKNYKYKTPNVTFIQDREKNQLTLDYEIERHQNNKAWNEQIDFFRGTVILDLNGNDLEIITKNISTAKETLSINRKIIGHIKSELVQNKIILETTKEEKILMNDMNNKEILKFLLAFTNNDVLINIKFVNIISIDIEIDGTISLPPESQIKWMENKIKNLKLDGTKIEDIEILTNDENHEYLKCWGLVAKYEFIPSKISGEGSTELDLKFNAKNKNEFFIQINKFDLDTKNYQKKDIEEMILNDIDSIKYKKHKEIIENKNI